jgi:hypothetical protein
MTATPGTYIWALEQMGLVKLDGRPRVVRRRPWPQGAALRAIIDGGMIRFERRDHVKPGQPDTWLRSAFVDPINIVTRDDRKARDWITSG